MDRSRLPALLTHYLAMFFAVWIVMSTVWEVVGRLAIWAELGILVVVCALYILLVRRLGIEPRSWSTKG